MREIEELYCVAAKTSEVDWLRVIYLKSLHMVNQLLVNDTGVM